MTLGEKLKKARLDRGLSQKAAAGDRMTRNMLSLLESDSARPSMRNLTYLAGVYGVPVSAFLDEPALPDEALSPARAAFRQGRWRLCLDLLKALPAGGEEALVLKARAALAAAEDSLSETDWAEAEALAAAALEADGRSLYGDGAVRARALLVTARCRLEQGGGFEAALARYEAARADLDRPDLYRETLARYAFLSEENPD